MNLVFLGKPGVGKGTDAAAVSKHFGIPCISMGELIRDEIYKGSEVGKKIKAVAEKGNLVDTKTAVLLLEERLKQPDTEKGFVLDGFPRSMEQVKDFEKAKKRIGRDFDLVVDFSCPDEAIVERLSNRRQCRKCKAIFNLKTNPSKESGKCDYCAGELYQRYDDMPEAIKKRLEIYEKESKPIKEFYKKKGIFVEMDGSKSIEEVVKELIAFLEKRFS